MLYKGIIQKYRSFLPVEKKMEIISLNEGNTPLVPSRRIASKRCPFLDLYFKLEGSNPTGSFKDRGMALAMTRAVHDKAQAVICASTGNTSASAAAYAARSHMNCFVLIPEGYVALGKLAQAMIHRAQVIQIKGNFDRALQHVRFISENYPIVLVNSLNPYRLEGQKTASFEIVDALGDAPVYHCIPVGNAGNITAYWKGYQQYKEAKKSKTLPKMMGFQAEGSAPFVKGRIINNPQTVATAIRIGNPCNKEKAEQAIQESEGLIDCVSDKEILEAYRMLASEEGLFVEPSSATSLAGFLKKLNKGFFSKKRVSVVCTLTGNGLKDPDNAVKDVPQPISVEDNLEEILKIMCYRSNQKKGSK